MSLPSLFLSRLDEIYPQDKAGILSAYSSSKVGSFRVNSLKGVGEEVQEELAAKAIETIPFSFIPGVFTYDKRHEYGLKGTRAFYDGKIYLQSLSSMLPVLALGLEKGGHILDLCAAPGSKTTQIAAIIENDGSIVAVEQNQIRYDKLFYNIRLQGATCIEGYKMDAEKFFREYTGEFFDRILVDAPCSAEGRIALGNPKSYSFWSVENIGRNAERQIMLLQGAVNLLKPDGVIVYSTCTIAPEENEGVVTHILAHHKNLELVAIDSIPKDWRKEGVREFQGQTYHSDIEKTVRILPSYETEGFYIAKFKRVT